MTAGKKQKQNKRNNERAGLSCAMSLSSIFGESGSQNNRYLAKKGDQHCWHFSPLRNDLLRDSRRGKRRRSKLNLTDTFPLHSPLLLSHIHTHTLTPNVNTLGLWQQCLRFFEVLDLHSCKYNLINALANEAHYEVSQQLIEDEGWRAGIRWGQRVSMGEEGVGVEGWRGGSPIYP